MSCKHTRWSEKLFAANDSKRCPGLQGRSGLMRALLFISGLLLSRAAMCADAGWLQGFYYDNMNKGNIKEGIRIGDNKRYDFPNLGYADVEAGEQGHKVTMGAGFLTHGGAYAPPVMTRIGVSYANFRTQKLAGVEAVFSAGTDFAPPIGISLKIGLYDGLHGTPSRFMVGLGFGM